MLQHWATSNMTNLSKSSILTIIPENDPACEYFSDQAENITLTQLLIERHLEKLFISCADLVSIIGNVLVIVTICFNMRLRRTVASLLLLSLSSANLLFSIVVVPVHIFQPMWMSSTNFACKFLRVLQS